MLLVLVETNKAKLSQNLPYDFTILSSYHTKAQNMRPIPQTRPPSYSMAMKTAPQPQQVKARSHALTFMRFGNICVSKCMSFVRLKNISGFVTLFYSLPAHNFPYRYFYFSTNIATINLYIFFTRRGAQNMNKPKPQPRSKMPQPGGDDDDAFLNMPNVPLDLPDIPNDGLGRHANGNPPPPNEDIDFDDLSRRFEELTKRK